MGDFRLEPFCAKVKHLPEACKGLFEIREKERCEGLSEPRSTAVPYCPEPWCYVDPKACDMPYSPSNYFPGRDLYFSYATCSSNDFFNIWGVPSLELCERFQVVEKPYYVMWISCWLCAFLQQVTDATRHFEENQDQLSKGQRAYLIFQLFVLITETIA